MSIVGKPSWHVDVDLDARARQPIRLEREDALDERRDTHGDAFGRALAREVEHVRRRSAGFDRPPATSSVGVLAQVFGQAIVVADQLAERDDRGERVVQLVRDTGHELADRVHLLGRESLVL